MIPQAPQAPLAPEATQRFEQRWPWWPLLPLYPYGHRPSLIRELLPGRVWSVEQLHGVWYVAVPIRMTVLKVNGGLLLYSPVAPTAEVVAELRRLEVAHGPVSTIVLATASGLEHKVAVPAMARAFAKATVWVCEGQWSFPLRLPSAWLGFPSDRTKVLFRDGLPHADQLAWIGLGPLDLGLGNFVEVACLDRSSGCLLVTDALVSFTATVPAIFELDPTPLLFHARNGGADPLIDTEANRIKGWKRILLFANFFRPAAVSVPKLGEILGQMYGDQCNNPRSHFGFYPFRWSEDWESDADDLIRGADESFGISLAPVLERLVFVRAQEPLLEWLRKLGQYNEITSLVSAHYDAPKQLKATQLIAIADRFEQRSWAPSQGSWQTLASIDQTLIRLGLVGAVDSSHR